VLRTLSEQPARTLAEAFTLHGVGLHGGRVATLRVEPSQRLGLRFAEPGAEPVPIAAMRLVSGDHASTLATPKGQLYRGVEHLLAALCGCQVDAAVLSLEQADEVPILDGSAAPFAERIGAVGLVSLERPRVELHLERAFVVEAHGARYDLRPAPHLQLEVHLEFGARWGTHPRSFSWDGTAFSTTLAAARTFTFSDWLDELRARDLIRGGSLDNAVVFEDGRVLNEGGLRFADEPARHKTLDLLGDLARLGAPLCASITAHRPGHTANAALVQRLSQELSSSAL